MHYWMYRSKAKVAPRSSNDALIWLQAVSANRAHGINGYLHREGGYYVQYVEGGAADIDRLKRCLRRDWRHGEIVVLAEGEIDSRRFAGWDMAFTDEETSSFAAAQRMTGGQEDIARASTEEVFSFMERMARTQAASPSATAV